MRKVWIFIFAWIVSTAIYIALNITISDRFERFDLFEVGYFLISVIPSALSYRWSSYKYLAWLVENREIDASRFQIQILGTLSPLFLGKLFFGSAACNKQKNRNIIRITFVVSILFWVGSIMTIAFLDTEK